jgi:hypothetical protein
MWLKNLILNIANCVCPSKCFYKIHNVINILSNRHCQEKIKIYLNTTLEFGKIIIGCLLVFAIPQLCSGIDPNLQIILADLNITNYNLTFKISLLEQHQCTINEIFKDIFTYKVFVITWNILCLILFFINFILELHRERYIINHFENTISKPLKNIFIILKNNKKLENKYMKLSKYLFYMNYLCSGFMFLNIVFSSILVYIYGYNGYRSITGLFSSILLVIEKLYYNYSVLNLVMTQCWVFSTKNVKPVSYNVLNPRNQTNFINNRNYNRTHKHKRNHNINNVNNINNINNINTIDLFDIEKENPNKSYNDSTILSLVYKEDKKYNYNRLYRNQASMKIMEKNNNTDKLNTNKLNTLILSKGYNTRLLMSKNNNYIPNVLKRKILMQNIIEYSDSKNNTAINNIEIDNTEVNNTKVNNTEVNNTNNTKVNNTEFNKVNNTEVNKVNNLGLYSRANRNKIQNKIQFDKIIQDKIDFIDTQ